MDLSGFPNCPTGDVLVCLTPDRLFKMHAALLRTQSTFFARQLQNENAAGLSDQAKFSGVKTLWRFDLVERPEPDEHDAGVLSMTKLDHHGRPIGHQRLAAMDVSTAKTQNPIYLYYHKIFAALYGQSIEIAAGNMTNLLIEIIGLIDVGEYLGCMKTVSKPIEAALLGEGQNLWRAVTSDPAAWSTLALRINSPPIMQEAVLHLAGMWNSLPQETKNERLNEHVRRLAEEQHGKLVDLGRKVQRRLTNWYPDVLTRQSPILGPGPARATYANDIYIWMSLCLFRQFVCTAFMNNKHHTAPDGGFSMYRVIADGDYLSRNELAQFHGKFPMSQRGKSTLSDHVRVIREMVKPFVQHLLKNESQLDTDRHAVQHLTCLKVPKEDVQAIFAAIAKEEAEEEEERLACAEDSEAEEEQDDFQDAEDIEEYEGSNEPQASECEYQMEEAGSFQESEAMVVQEAVEGYNVAEDGNGGLKAEAAIEDDNAVEDRDDDMER